MPRPKTAQPAPQPVPEVKKAEPQELPVKEAALFRSLVKYYESKQYKKAIKTSDAILKKFPNNGETLAMRGLTLSYMKEKEQGMALVKEGLKNNIKSQVCWHVLGILHRQDNNYEEAIKAFTMALRWDPENQQILKDLAQLQIQVRQLDGYEQTRYKLLMSKSGNRNNWLAYALAIQLNGKPAKAAGIIDTFYKAQGEVKTVTYEDSELRLYRNALIAEQGDVQKALADLETQSPMIVDRLYWRERKAEYLFKLGKVQQAETEWRTLLEVNPDNHAYHAGLRTCLGCDSKDGSLSEEQVAKLVEAYEGLQKSYPHAAAPKRLPLDFLQGDAFKSAMDAYLRRGIRKGIPSLFSDVSPLYANAAKAQLIQSLLDSYLPQLKQHRRFAAEDAEDSESPSSLLWALFFAASHYDFLGQADKALSVADEATTHTPTLVDLYVLKARIYKHAGDMLSAYTFMDKARRLDTQDRYLNTKCVRYALRADKIEEAKQTVALFLKEGDAASTLFDLQVNWYTLGLADSYARQGQLGHALKFYLDVKKHFSTYREDEYDFHFYCLRKTTLRSYLDMIKFENGLKSHKFFVRMAVSAANVYLDMWDRRHNPVPAAAAASTAAAAGAAGEATVSAEDKKKQAKKQRKQQANQTASEREAAEKAAAEAKTIEELNNTADPLAEATKLLQDLDTFAGDKLETHLLACKLYLRKQKPLLVLKHLRLAAQIDAQSPTLHAEKQRFKRLVAKLELHPTVKQVIDAEIAEDSKLGLSASIEQSNETLLQSHGASLAHRLAVARIVLEGDKTSAANRSKAAELLSKPAECKAQVTHEVAQEAYSFLAKEVQDEAAASSFRSAVSAVFPLSVGLMGAAAQQAVAERFVAEQVPIVVNAAVALGVQP